ncbi:MAG: FtsW/RodA/SpoVE family cell cycle protein [Bacillaceae bacterium]
MIKRVLRNIDYFLFIPVIFLCTIGIIMVYSAGIGAEFFGGAAKGITAKGLFNTQRMAILIGVFFCFILGFVLPYRFFDRRITRWIVLVVSWGLLGGVLAIGDVVNGSKSWIQMGGVSLQPSEFSKLALIVPLASYYGKLQQKNNPFWKKTMVPMYKVALITFVLVFLQGDIGTLAVMAAICFGMLLCSGYKVKRILLISVPLFVAGYSVILLIAKGKLAFFSGYRFERFANMLYPFEQFKGSGWQLSNSYLAIASGGIQGKGLGESIQKFGYLPEPQTDFIFSIIAEELGFFGVLVIFLCYAILIGRILFIALKCKDPYGTLICVGVSTMIMSHIILNIGAIVGLVPLTGVPLPFLSYGGTAMISMLMAIGLVLNVSRYVKRQEEKINL